MTTTNPRAHGTLATPDIPAGSAAVTAYASTRIAAPASLVFRTLRNSDTWRDWNRFVPRVKITYQPPEIEDLATAAEIRELINNTTLAGSVDSDITDGAAPGTHSLTGRRLSLQEEETIRRSPPPVTRERLRSVASTASTASMHTARSKSTSSVGPRASTDDANGTAAKPLTNGHSSHAHAQAQAQARRKSSLAPLSPAEQHRRSIHALYGEPSVRIQLGTKMTLYCRMHLPQRWNIDREVHVVVTEVSRPDDPAEGVGDIAALAAAAAAPAGLRKSVTHTPNRSGVYRLVWTLRTTYTSVLGGSSSSSSSSLSAPPKFMLQAQRVHEIRPVIAGDGTEECVYDDWECQRGILAKSVKSKYEAYLNERFEDWGNGLKAYCEALGGAVERRDFVNAE